MCHNYLKKGLRTYLKVGCETVLKLLAGQDDSNVATIHTWPQTSAFELRPSNIDAPLHHYTSKTDAPTASRWTGLPYQVETGGPTASQSQLGGGVEAGHCSWGYSIGLPDWNDRIAVNAV